VLRYGQQISSANGSWQISDPTDWVIAIAIEMIL